VGAELVDETVVAVVVTEGDQPLREQLDPHRWAVPLGEFVGQQRRDPVLPEHLAHRRAAPRLRE
jgi:hypothetical protein